MIISINGRIGHGKDTVGRIIQYLTSEYKNKYNFAEWKDRVENYGSNTYSSFEIKKFAAKLKIIASLLTGIPVEMFEDQEFKKTNLSDEWSIGYGKKLDESYTNILPMTVRELLQKLGTEAMRDGLHENVWCNALFSDYVPKRETLGGDGIWVETDKDYVHFGERFTYPSWCITDMRFPNEMEAVKERGGITIRVNRDNWKPNAGDIILIKVFSNWSTVTYTHTDSEGNHFGVGTDGFSYKSRQIKQSNLHPSETALDDAEFDYTIVNDSTIDDLVEKVREILIERNII